MVVSEKHCRKIPPVQIDDKRMFRCIFFQIFCHFFGYFYPVVAFQHKICIQCCQRKNCTEEKVKHLIYTGRLFKECRIFLYCILEQDPQRCCCKRNGIFHRTQYGKCTQGEKKCKKKNRFFHCCIIKTFFLFFPQPDKKEESAITEKIKWNVQSVEKNTINLEFYTQLLCNKEPGGVCPQFLGRCLCCCC